MKRPPRTPRLGRPPPSRQPPEDSALPTRAAQQLLQPVERGAAMGPGPASRRLHGGRGRRLVPGADPQRPVPRHRPAVAGKAPRRAGSRADPDNDPDAAGLRPTPVRSDSRAWAGWTPGGRGARGAGPGNETRQNPGARDPGGRGRPAAQGLVGGASAGPGKALSPGGIKAKKKKNRKPLLSWHNAGTLRLPEEKSHTEKGLVERYPKECCLDCC